MIRQAAVKQDPTRPYGIMQPIRCLISIANHFRTRWFCLFDSLQVLLPARSDCLA